jgi:hypothetical protein
MEFNEKQIKEKKQRHEQYLRLIAKDPEYYLRKHRAFHKAHPEKCAEYSRKYKQTHPGKVGRLVDKWCHENLPKHNAGCNARRLTKLKNYCEFCGDKEKRRVRHHFDYTKPLEVTTLCVPCHKAVHRVMKDYGFQEPTLILPDSRHCDNCAKSWPVCSRKCVSLKGRNCASWEEINKSR